MTGPRTIVITGASSGIGAAAARALASGGHRVVVVGRSARRTQEVADELDAPWHVADFARLGDVRRLAHELLDAHPRIDVLANNAGGAFGDRTRTEDGFERNFQINHLAPFLLTQLLLSRLIDSRAAVLQTSSSGARLSGRLDIDDLQSERVSSLSRIYGTTKLENILFTRELDRRYHPDGISAAAFDPGNVASRYGEEASGIIHRIATNRIARRFWLAPPERGAEQLVWLASSQPGVDWRSGVYYEQRAPAKRVNPQVDDDVLARELWTRSEALLAPADARR